MQYKFLNKLLSYLDLESDVDSFQQIHETIEKDIIFKGTNLWILIFAVIVASVGLNMNSTAVIIGAMLISPLMGPINGMGYSIATYNFPLFRTAVKNFSFAVIASLIASTTYFAISPISAAHSELLARTSPTIYDVLIALFGGLAGIVAISSKHKGNVIPGVAIATALMPPLCTAGYGLATSQFAYFFGAIYLFTINTVFIAISSVAISQILKFPILSDISAKQKQKIHQGIWFVTILVLLPSIYFGFKLVQKEKFITNANAFVNKVSVMDSHYLLKNEIKPIKRTIVLVYAGTALTDIQKQKIRDLAQDYSLNDVKIEFPQELAGEDFSMKNTESDKLKAEMNRLSLLLKEKDARLDSLEVVKRNGQFILNEIMTIYPQVYSCSYAETFKFSDTLASPEKIKVVVFKTKGKSLLVNEKSKINDWLKKRLQSETIKVFYEQ